MLDSATWERKFPSTVMLSQYVSSLKSTRILVVSKFVDPQSVQSEISCHAAATGRHTVSSSISTVNADGPIVRSGLHRRDGRILDRCIAPLGEKGSDAFFV
jgi:hypothetical protein